MNLNQANFEIERILRSLDKVNRKASLDKQLQRLSEVRQGISGSEIDAYIYEKIKAAYKKLEVRKDVLEEKNKLKENEQITVDGGMPLTYAEAIKEEKKKLSIAIGRNEEECLKKAIELFKEPEVIVDAKLTQINDNASLIKRNEKDIVEYMAYKEAMGNAYVDKYLYCETVIDVMKQVKDKKRDHLTAAAGDREDIEKDIIGCLNKLVDLGVEKIPKIVIEDNDGNDLIDFDKIDDLDPSNYKDEKDTMEEMIKKNLKNTRDRHSMIQLAKALNIEKIDEMKDEAKDKDGNPKGESEVSVLVHHVSNFIVDLDNKNKKLKTENINALKSVKKFAKIADMEVKQDENGSYTYNEVAKSGNGEFTKENWDEDYRNNTRRGRIQDRYVYYRKEGFNPVLSRMFSIFGKKEAHKAISEEKRKNRVDIARTNYAESFKKIYAAGGINEKAAFEKAVSNTKVKTTKER